MSGNHCEITNGFALDNGSTNGTTLNGAPLKNGVKKMLKGGDKLQIGDRILRIEVGAPRSATDGQDLSRSKKFIGGVAGAAEADKKDGAEAASASSAPKESDEDAKLSVEELMDKEFARIIGHDSLKKQLRQFYKKVQLDQIRIKAGKEKDAKRLYHMIFSGPPGTGQQPNRRQYQRSVSIVQPSLVHADAFVLLMFCSLCAIAAVSLSLSLSSLSFCRQDDDGEFGFQNHAKNEARFIRQGCICE